MQNGKRLEAIAQLVPAGVSFADIGTDHAYLPVQLVRAGKITSAVAGDIAAGPCRAARSTVAMHSAGEKISVRMGSGLSVLKPGEAECIAIAGMGGATIINILQDGFAVAASAQVLILQPMAGAPSLRRWLLENGWEFYDEELVDDEPHFYEIIAARRKENPAAKENFTEAELYVGPMILRKKHPLLAKQFARQINFCRELLANMEKSERARASEKYSALKNLQQEVEALQNEYVCES